MNIFLGYLKVSLWMAPMILLALWLLPKLSRRYTAKLSYVVWLVIAVRLLVPWNLTLPEETAPIHVYLPQETMVQWTPVDLSEDTSVAAAEAEEKVSAEGEKTPIAEPEASVSPMQMIFAVWLAGAAISLLRTAVSTYQLKKLLKRWEKAPSDKISNFYAETAGEKRPPLAVSPVLETPMAVGLFHTKIYLPHEDYSRQELEMIFRHELIHWRRKDLWYKGVLLLARSIHWFNPLVWLLAKRANRDLEVSCDGEAVQGEDAAYRKAYGLMILQEAERSLAKQAALTTCFSDGKKALQERMMEIMNESKRKRGMTLIVMTLVLAVTCGCLVGYGGADEGGEELVKQASANAKLVKTGEGQVLEEEETKSETVAVEDHEQTEFEYTLVETKETSAEGEYTLAKTKEEGAEPADATIAADSSIPSGYPTSNMTINTPFVMGEDAPKQHAGIDFSTDNKNIPVHATADGVVLEAGFDSNKGNYVKINHLNGFTTLYAHLSALDVKAGDEVKQGDTLGLAGKTGTAVGVHCHYEVQLNGNYQDPAKYL